MIGEEVGGLRGFVALWEGGSELGWVGLGYHI